MGYVTSVNLWSFNWCVCYSGVTWTEDSNTLIRTSSDTYQRPHIIRETLLEIKVVIIYKFNKRTELILS